MILIYLNENEKDFIIERKEKQYKFPKLILIMRSELYRGMFLSVTNDTSNKVTDYSELISAWDKNSYKISVTTVTYYSSYYSPDCRNEAHSGSFNADVCYPVIDHDISSFQFDSYGYIYQYDSYDCTGSETSDHISPGECINLPDSGNLGSTFSVLLSLVFFLFSFFF
ncbi:hypothetical protein M0811_09058 [Anaeramoeba ignava]|uniref:Uncharacterized protein n=1 Tax=Anaeramoeba ignava TaxID=1746090 RepID=A0A9Q0LKJ7_ANAIG|nr:hypothetical protein M0811_09058 [Anaeramoeba ignava]